ncbi:4-carboxy-4-hydroxy-2-oxoadipate aldolase/oxaloacetate decarboxylase [Hydrogenophaga intermedia]|uniref:4-carboxy-4-hydroxy-2-oxoadipate aldolase/oxaloacetate decarboxylase n=1 Tax=Hydrogenophaga intermedia TaxID=65786 RepID=UPI0020439DB5|nr:4-carboxy-4-hydroxy-2-oxoadipate aldolase/oxaloacetate decarboxylase [Hydrogenophaga intermedia]MCM3562841.1 4-carboxy-4-hydroxy-2-oxoadipate aldolase/oxaloacetate decarboxylase [Hydrogenophaga intermedia]
MPSGPTIRADIDRVAPAVVEKARRLSAATLHEAAGRIGSMPSAIKPVAPSFRICGPVVTVDSPGADNLWLHRAIYVTQPGDVLVVHVGDAHEWGYWGEIMSVAAKARGLGGLAIDGCVRDGAMLEQLGFPVFARGLCIRGTGKDFDARGWINHPTLFGNLAVHPGDLVVGDADGVVVLPRQRAAELVHDAEQREAKEAAILQRLRAGERTLEIYNF